MDWRATFVKVVVVAILVTVRWEQIRIGYSISLRYRLIEVLRENDLTMMICIDNHDDLTAIPMPISQKIIISRTITEKRSVRISYVAPEKSEFAICNCNLLSWSYNSTWSVSLYRVQLTSMLIINPHTCLLCYLSLKNEKISTNRTM